jgi:hypothetical protein
MNGNNRTFFTVNNNRKGEGGKFHFSLDPASFLNIVCSNKTAHTQSLHRLNNRSLNQENGEGPGKPIKNKTPLPVYMLYRFSA